MIGDWWAITSNKGQELAGRIPQADIESLGFKIGEHGISEVLATLYTYNKLDDGSIVDLLHSYTEDEKNAFIIRTYKEGVNASDDVHLAICNIENIKDLDFMFKKSMVYSKLNKSIS